MSIARSRLRKPCGKRPPTWSVAIATVVAMTFNFWLNNVLTYRDQLNTANPDLTNIVLQYSYILVLAIGMVIVIIGGHIDLSVGSVVALTGAFLLGIGGLSVWLLRPGSTPGSMRTSTRKCNFCSSWCVVLDGG